MLENPAAALTIFVLAIFVGFEVISKVPPLLHTPLMSGSNAISGITIVGAILATGGENGTVATALGFVAIVMAHLRPAWATISAHGLASIELPRPIRTVTIGADNDRSGAGQDAALKCRKRLEREGREVRVMFPKRQGMDWLDVFRKGYG